MTIAERCRRACSRARALSLFTTLALAMSLGLVGCSDDTNGDGGACPDGVEPHPITGLCQAAEQCGPGEYEHEITGDCYPKRDMVAMDNDGMTSPNNTPGADMPAEMGGAEEMGGEDADMDTMADMPDEEEMGPDCREGVDTDNDGLDNACECAWGGGLFVDQADSDGDGLLDGEEDADASCGVTLGETDPRTADTDGDGIDDKTEVDDPDLDPLRSDSDDDGITDGVEASTCTDPGLADTDGDGLDDGVEDSNGDGMIGTCPMRMYATTCAAGESDPCSDDTDGDGTLDNDEVIYRTCRPADENNLVMPQLLKSTDGDYQLATETSATASALTSTGGSIVNGHVFEDPTHHYTGFVINLPSPTTNATATQLADEVFNETVTTYPMASRRNAGRQITTHDDYKAIVGAVVDLPMGTTPEGARDGLLEQLTGLSDLTHSLTSTIPVGAMEPALFSYEVIARGPNEYVLVGVVAPLTKLEDDALETGFRVDDLVNGSAVAREMETITSDCVSFKVTERPKVDIIISMDASGSMTDEQMALSMFVTDLTGFLDAANLDWRIGVTSVACSGISNDMGLGMDFRALWPAGGGFIPMGPCSQPFGGGFGGTSNGGLVKQNTNEPGFTNDPLKVQWRIDNVSDTNSEYTATMGAAAVARALPRSDTNGDKIRNNAAVVVIAVTDEEDDFFKETLSFLPKENLNASERMQMEAQTNPFVDYLLQPEVGATVFGLYNVPNSDCSTASQFASAIHDIVNKTGGNGGSICQSDITTSLQAITSATAGIASGLRLRGSPVAPSIEVKHAKIMADTEVDMARSRVDGFDYDGIVNRIAFFGPSPPQTNDRLVVPYLRWENSVLNCTTEADCPAEQKYKCIDNECR